MMNIANLIVQIALLIVDALDLIFRISERKKK